MTDEEAAEAKLIYAPDWPSKMTSIEEIRKRTGTTPMSPEDFDRHSGGTCGASESSLGPKDSRNRTPSELG
ncbi:MAG: hypothetical protein WD404_01140 [Solirubrobacterales bacterium]